MNPPKKMLEKSHHASRGWLCLACFGLLLCLVGCGEPEGPQQKPLKEVLKVYCGSGLRPVVSELLRRFELEHKVEIQAWYAGSEVLNRRIFFEEGPDIFIPGNDKYLDNLDDAGLLARRVAFCQFVPAIMVQNGNPKNVKGLKDFLRPELKYGLGHPNACAIGRVSQQIFKKNKLPTEDITSRADLLSLTVRELSLKVADGTLDMAICWNALARYDEKRLESIALKDRNNVISAVAVGLLKTSELKQKANRLLEYLNSADAQQLLKGYGYSPVER
jgi:molybdate transport system substrate-binding protein